MTDSAITTAASNGDDTTRPVPAQRVHGMDRLREDECYRLASLIRDCLGEAEHLIRKVYNKARNRVTDPDGSKGTRPLDRVEARRILDEAYDCTSLALTYIYSASQHLQEADDKLEPIF
jgi:hypothetical protein